MLILLGLRGAARDVPQPTSFVDAVARRVRAVAAERQLDLPDLAVLDLDGPFAGEPLTVGAASGTEVSVRWSGVELTRASAIFVERPAFSWPQPIGGAARREIAALRLSALATLAECAPMANAPASAELALAPVLALDRLAARDVAVHGWHYGPRVDDGLAWRDGVGRLLDYEPASPALGELAWRPEAFGDPTSELATWLVIGDRVAGVARSATLQEWTHTWSDAHRTLALAADAALDDAFAALALRATRELELVFAAVTLVRERDVPRVVDVDVAPDFVRWDHALDGGASAACARWLVSRSVKEPVR